MHVRNFKQIYINEVYHNFDFKWLNACSCVRNLSAINLIAQYPCPERK